MRKLLLFCAILIASVANADNPTTPPPTGENIPLDSNLNIPRPLSLNADIEATFFEGVLTFIFNRDLGVADIVVTNVISGDQWCDTIYGVGSTSLVVDGDAGAYQIVIYTDYGEYTGAFVI